MKIYRTITLSLLLFLTAAGVRAQQQNDRELYRSWMQGQRAILSSLSEFSVHADIKHAVKSGGGERVAMIEMTFSRGDEGPRVRGVVDFLSLNGDTLDVSERRRIQRSLSVMMTPEIGPMLNEYILPIQLLAGARPAAEPVEDEIDGRLLIKYAFALAPREQRRRPSADGRRRPGSPPMQRQRPGGRRPGGPGMDRMNAPQQGMMIWLDPETAELVQTRMHVRSPSDRRLMAETHFERINGLDVPISRLVRGAFPMQRRLRTITLVLDHYTEYSDYVITSAKTE